MDVAEYRNIYENEDRHFFYVSTHDLVMRLMEKYAKKRESLKILDAGCGTGLLATKLKRFGTVKGIDFSKEAVRFSQKRGVDVRQASVTDLPFADGSFDVVVSIDVLVSKSIEDDMEAFAEFRRVLKPGGLLILRVSANPWLKMVHDEHVHMIRRYGKSELREKLMKSEFEIAKLTYVHAVLFPLIVVKYGLERLFKPEAHSTIGSVHPVVNAMLTLLLRVENWLLMRWNLPFGVGLVAVSQTYEEN